MALRLLRRQDWVERLETYIAAEALDDDRWRPILLHLGGAAIHKLKKSMVEDGLPFTYNTLKQAISAHFKVLALSAHFKRFLLHKAWQLPEESMDSFYDRLKDVASTCTLLDANDEI
ncbi:hypothetical protein NDU88_010145 [Pleurodeles waltl]|uniref:Retrotransposon gag domain-containing protein n=1 Tax=Pleurodeles waltl TaxID=8319 RepID=A0AAV7PUC7_PLEWA|nr:hypothetical protein NDU88_010145 [Pleurodeles waltl]